MYDKDYWEQLKIYVSGRTKRSHLTPATHQEATCATCNRILPSPSSRVCTHCLLNKEEAKSQLMVKTREGGTPFYILAALLALLFLAIWFLFF